MRAIKKPIPIDVEEFKGQISPNFRIRVDRGGLYHVWNELHQSWIGISVGDYVNVTDPNDTYPIDKDAFARTYDVIPDNG